MLPLSLFASGTSDYAKSAIVTALLHVGRPQHFQPQKPVMTAEMLDNRQPGEVHLHNFIGESSLLMFYLMEVQSDAAPTGRLVGLPGVCEIWEPG